MTIVNPTATFRAEYMTNKGIYVAYQLTGTPAVNILDGRRIFSLTKGAETWDQEEIKHLLQEDNYKSFVTLMANPGSIDISYYLDPRDTPVSAPSVVRSYATAGQGTLYVARYYPATTTGGNATVEVFFESLANIAETASWEGEFAKPLVSKTKFQLVGAPTWTQLSAA
ncbi:MAG: hypothetical protein PHE53_12375 [Thermoguttaceae bacterium]|nr:hypothetical protein [Thermoguttaceae bacterium]